jgi:hypothetical protein
MATKYADIVNKVIKHFGSQNTWNRITGNCRLISAEKDRVKVEFDVSEEMTKYAFYYNSKSLF